MSGSFPRRTLEQSFTIKNEDFSEINKILGVQGSLNP